MKLKRIICLLGAVAMVAAIAAPVEAACSVSRQITSVSASGYSYVYTPGICDGGGNCPGESSITPRFTAQFWVIGAGDPTPLMGTDSGTMPAIEGSDGGIMYVYPGYPAYVARNWNSDNRIDGCPDTAIPAGNLCTTVVLTDDTGDGIGYSALITKAALNGDYFLNLPGDAPIILAAIGRPSITGSTRPDTTSVLIDVAPPVLDGLYLDSACNDPVVGYRVYQQSVPAGAQPPSVRDVSSWNAVSAPDVPLTSGTTVSVTCGADVDVYLTTSIQFDSGFETLSVSQNSSRVECGPNVADVQERPRPRPGQSIDLRERGGKKGGR